MPSEKKYRYQLEAYWNREWRRLWGSDKRLELDAYVAGCKDPAVRFRVIDTWEEEVMSRGRRHKP